MDTYPRKYERFERFQRWARHTNNQALMKELKEYERGNKSWIEALEAAILFGSYSRPCLFAAFRDIFRRPKGF